MPIYEYGCRVCGHKTDILHGINEEGPRFCPECGAEGTMRKGFAPPAIVFKGSGWAKKDRSSVARTKAATRAGEPTDSKPGSGDGGSSSESKAGSGDSGGGGGSNDGGAGKSSGKETPSGSGSGSGSGSSAGSSSGS